MQKVKKILSVMGAILISVASMAGQSYASMTASNVEKLDSSPFLVTRVGVNENKITVAFRRKAVHLSLAIWDTEHFMAGYNEGVVDEAAFERMTEGEVEWGNLLIDTDVSDKPLLTEVDLPVREGYRLSDENSMHMFYYAVRWEDGTYMRGKLSYANCWQDLIRGRNNGGMMEEDRTYFEAGVWECQAAPAIGYFGLAPVNGTYMSEATRAVLVMNGNAAEQGLRYEVRKIDESDSELPGDIKTLKTVAGENALLTSNVTGQGQGGNQGGQGGGAGSSKKAGEEKEKVRVPETGVAPEEKVQRGESVWGMLPGLTIGVVGIVCWWLLPSKTDRKNSLKK